LIKLNSTKFADNWYRSCLPSTNWTATSFNYELMPPSEFTRHSGIHIIYIILNITRNVVIFIP